MTVIAAFQDKDKYWIASDSVGSDGQMKYEIGSKLIRKGNYIIGFSWSYRVADLIKECQELPTTLNGMKDLRFVRDIIKLLLSMDGTVNDQEPGIGGHPVDLVIVSPAGLYTIENDYQIHRVPDGYMANGSGTEIAMGVLYSCKELNIPGRKAVKLAVQAATKHIMSCGGKCHIKSIDKKRKKL